MAAPTWLSAVGHFVSDVAGAALGFQWAESRRQTAETVGKEVRRVLMPDRKEIMREILYLGDKVKALFDLLVEAEESGFVEVDGKRKAENWIINMLLKVDTPDRGWVFRLLNEVLETQGRKEFFAHLNVLHNDGWLQYLKLVKAQFDEAIGRVKEKLPERKELKRKLKKADEALNDAVLQFRANQRWFKGRRARQDRLRNQLMERQERQTHERVAEAFDRFRREWPDKKGGRQ